MTTEDVSTPEILQQYCHDKAVYSEEEICSIGVRTPMVNIEIYIREQK